MVVSERVARRRAQTRRRIFTEAMRLFEERGFDAVTVADITEAADIGKGTFFTYFPSKSDVFRYLGEQVTDAVLDALAEAEPDTPAADRIRLVYATAAAWLEDHPDPARQMALSRSIRPSADVGSENQRRIHAALGGVIAQGQAAGEFRTEVDVEDAVLTLQGQYYLTIVAWALRPEGRALGERLAAAVDITLRGLA